MVISYIVLLGFAGIYLIRLKNRSYKTGIQHLYLWGENQRGPLYNLNGTIIEGYKLPSLLIRFSITLRTGK